MTATAARLVSTVTVFELPEEFPSDWCFGGGIPTTFHMVDWFQAVPVIEDLTKTLERKVYVKPGRYYLAIGQGFCFMFKGEK